MRYNSGLYLFFCFFFYQNPAASSLEADAHHSLMGEVGDCWPNPHWILRGLGCELTAEFIAFTEQRIIRHFGTTLDNHHAYTRDNMEPYVFPLRHMPLEAGSSDSLDVLSRNLEKILPRLIVQPGSFSSFFENDEEDQAIERVLARYNVYLYGSSSEGTEGSFDSETDSSNSDSEDDIEDEPYLIKIAAWFALQKRVYLDRKRLLPPASPQYLVPSAHYSDEGKLTVSVSLQETDGLGPSAFPSIVGSGRRRAARQPEELVEVPPHFQGMLAHFPTNPIDLSLLAFFLNRPLYSDDMTAVVKLIVCFQKWALSSGNRQDMNRSSDDGIESDDRFENVKVGIRDHFGEIAALAEVDNNELNKTLALDIFQFIGSCTYRSHFNEATWFYVHEKPRVTEQFIETLCKRFDMKHESGTREWFDFFQRGVERTVEIPTCLISNGIIEKYS